MVGSGTLIVRLDSAYDITLLPKIRHGSSAEMTRVRLNQALTWQSSWDYLPLRVGAGYQNPRNGGVMLQFGGHWSEWFQSHSTGSGIIHVTRIQDTQPCQSLFMIEFPSENLYFAAGATVQTLICGLGVDSTACVIIVYCLKVFRSILDFSRCSFVPSPN